MRFENRLSGFYAEILRRLLTPDSYQNDPDSESDGMVLDGEQFITEINILHEPVEHTRHECRQALLVLDGHITSMLDDIDSKNIINPMQPEIVYSAFWDSCDDLRCGAEIRLIMLQIFQRQVAMDLVNIYGDINVLLDFCLQNNSLIDDERTNILNKIKLPAGQLEAKTHDPYLVISWAQYQISQIISDQDLPDMIEIFLFEHWSELLANIFCQYSMDSLEWERAIQVVDDLVEASTLSHDKQSKLQQIWQFPGLIYRLKAGMKLIALPLSIQAKFISDLKVFHSQLVNQNSNIKNN